MTLTDEDLIAQMAQGQQDALRELHERYAPYLYSLGRRMLRDPSDTESCVQDAFMNAWKAAARFDRRLASAKTWLITIAHRRFLQAIRDRPDTSLPIEDWDSPTRSPDPTDRVLAERALGILTESEHRLVELAYYQGHSHAEVADLTGIPLGTVKTRLRAALARMKTHLNAGQAAAELKDSSTLESGQPQPGTRGGE